MEENESINQSTINGLSDECRELPAGSPQDGEASSPDAGALPGALSAAAEEEALPDAGDAPEAGGGGDGDPPVPADPDPDPDPCASGGAPEDPAGELSRLRDELNGLKDALAKKEAFFNRLSSELSEFSELYPDVPVSEIPDPVWADVRKGIPLAASFALMEKRAATASEAAARANRQNSLRSSGALESPENDYFSPDEVRTMSREEVHSNYSKIMASMPKWH